MNILMARPRLEVGGATKSILLLAEELSKLGHNITLATHNGNQVKAAQQLGLNLRLLPLYPSSISNLIRSSFVLRKIIHQENIDLLHSHHRFSNLVCKLASIFTGIPTVSTVHEFKYNQTWLTNWGQGQYVITFSKAIKAHLVSHYHIPDDRVWAVTIGIAPETPTPEEIALARKKLCLQTGVPALGSVSRLSEEKGINVLLEAISLIKSRGYKLHCSLVGDGPLRSEMEALSRQLAISDQVYFLGWQDNVSAIIANLDFLILPSLLEGLGLVILEGFAQAKPTIGSRVGGIPELIRDGQNGLLVTPNDPEDLAQAIIQLLENPDLIQKMGQSAQQDLVIDFSVEAMAKQTEKIYRAAVSRAR